MLVSQAGWEERRIGYTYMDDWSLFTVHLISLLALFVNRLCPNTKLKAFFKNKIKIMKRKKCYLYKRIQGILKEPKATGIWASEIVQKKKVKGLCLRFPFQTYVRVFASSSLLFSLAALSLLPVTQENTVSMLLFSTDINSARRQPRWHLESLALYPKHSC